MHSFVRSAVALLATASLIGALAPLAAAGTPEQARLFIEVKATSTSPWGIVGGGVLIADPASTTGSRWVLTAAHIPDAYVGKQMRVVAGTCDRTKLVGAAIATVQKSYYDGLVLPFYGNDFALLELETALNYGANVQPATLPDDNTNTFAGAVGSFHGWWKACSSILPVFCQTMDMDVLTNDATQTYWAAGPSGTVIWPNQMGVYDYLNENAPGAVGAGSGIFVQDAGSWKLVGINNFGMTGGGCPNPTFPTICARVSVYLDWIANTIAASTPAPGSSTGTSSYTPCGCTAMTLSSYGGMPFIGNQAFGLEIKNAPASNVPATLYLQVGAPLSVTGFSGGFGTWYLVNSPGIGLNVTASPMPAAPACENYFQFPLPLPNSIPLAAKGLVISAQALVMCPGVGLGTTNGWQFNLW